MPINIIKIGLLIAAIHFILGANCNKNNFRILVGMLFINLKLLLMEPGRSKVIRPAKDSFQFLSFTGQFTERYLM